MHLGVVAPGVVAHHQHGPGEHRGGGPFGDALDTLARLVGFVPIVDALGEHVVVEFVPGDGGVGGCAFSLTSDPSPGGRGG